jgi:NAD-dependent dihydropyrimidine dehydrogenase PreA subunit
MKAKLLIILAFVFTLSILVAGRPITYQITQNQCWVCGRCLYTCSVQAIYYDQTMESFQIDQNLCNGDGNCVNSCPYGAIHQVVGNSDEIAPPTRIKVNCYPNPMKETTKIEFKFPRLKTGKIEIYNIKGQVIRIFENLQPGQNELNWDGNDNIGKSIPSGTYFIKLIAGSESRISKITKVR